MRVENFPCYPHKDLADIRFNGKLAESVTYSFDKKNVKQNKLKQMLVNDKDCFIASTQIDKPTIRFKTGTEVDIDCGFIFESRCVCIGSFPYNYKGYRMKAFLFQYI
ncbi:hypothetical protein D3C75_185230 [compost metagenome]